jgi:hypothetical protein
LKQSHNDRPHAVDARIQSSVDMRTIPPQEVSPRADPGPSGAWRISFAPQCFNTPRGLASKSVLAALPLRDEYEV